MTQLTTNIEVINALEARETYSNCDFLPTPITPGQKKTPARGTTGRRATLQEKQMNADNAWKDAPDNSNVALSLLPGQLALDIDHYEDGSKQGWDHLANLFTEHGLNIDAYPWNEWPRSTRRGVDSLGVQFFFRVPDDLEYVPNPCEDVEIIQSAHRYAMVWPSKVDGMQYRWYIGDNESGIPHANDLPELPAELVHVLSRGPVRSAGNRVEEEGLNASLSWLESRVFGGESRAELPDDVHRYDTMVSTVLSLISDAVHNGHAGLMVALKEIRDRREAYELAESRALSDDYAGAVTSAVAKVKAEIASSLKPSVNWRERFGAEPFSDNYALPDFSDLIAGAAKKQAKKQAKKKAKKAAQKAEEPRGLGTERTYGGLRFSSLETAVIRSAQWVWGGEDMGGIPVGGLTIITGKPGDGKSTMCRWLAAEITHGSLPGTWNGTPHSVLYLSAEESQDHMVTPSLVANGADRSRVHVPLDPLNPAEDMAEVIAFCKDNDVKAVFVDPLSSYMGGTDSHKNSETRESLKPWSRLAEEIDGAVIAIVHQTKSSGSDFVSGINGSSAYGEVARAVFATAVDAESGKRVVSQGKNSLGPLMASHEYVLEIENLTTVDGEAKTSPRFSLGGETDLSAGEIFNRNKKVDSGETETAKSWLRDYLDANPNVFKAEIIASARGLYSEGAINKAKAELKVVTEYEDRKARWSLPSR